ncbi:GDP-6-deoxy-D-mannose reductase [Catellatospora sp. TT07R-123]|uniref:NAD-dependent epimerase/dehydratase family protein n=1 Tax=Catellatospora sp. TT07R-123 TaxID=2733863 RepID=UPI001B1A5CB5|nr:NAD-dependent epimerase/dehydratase family protein [Catellatospora sp. TT07R-123]GHJ45783.1 GDP-6-deoxy-D-mannose reductase [Catellatospora sp. TT07R-123]
MKIVVTGSSGFIGRHLVADLEGRGENVFAADLPHTDVRSAEGIADMISRIQPDLVYHLAAQANGALADSAAAEMWKTNVMGTVHVIEAVLAHRPSCRILLASTAAVYGEAADRIAETAYPTPRTSYAASKVAAEAAAFESCRRGADVVVARLFNIFGPGQRDDFFMPSLVRRVKRAVLTGDSHVAVANLRAVRDFVDVKDAVGGLQDLMARGESGAVYNVCSGEGVTIEAAARRLVEVAGCQVEILPSIQQGDETVLVGDPRATFDRTGWKTSTSLVESLAALLGENGLEGVRTR